METSINLLSPTSSILPSPVNNAHKYTKFCSISHLKSSWPHNSPTHSLLLSISWHFYTLQCLQGLLYCFCFLSSIILSTHFKDDFICAVLINPPRTPIITMLSKPVTSTFLNWWSVFTLLSFYLTSQQHLTHLINFLHSDSLVSLSTLLAVLPQSTLLIPLPFLHL